MAILCTINKICAGENISRDTSEEWQGPQNKRDETINGVRRLKSFVNS